MDTTTRLNKRTYKFIRRVKVKSHHWEEDVDVSYQLKAYYNDEEVSTDLDDVDELVFDRYVDNRSGEIIPYVIGFQLPEHLIQVPRDPMMTDDELESYRQTESKEQKEARELAEKHMSILPPQPIQERKWARQSERIQKRGIDKVIVHWKDDEVIPPPPTKKVKHYIIIDD